MYFLEMFSTRMATLMASNDVRKSFFRRPEIAQADDHDQGRDQNGNQDAVPIHDHGRAANSPSKTVDDSHHRIQAIKLVNDFTMIFPEPATGVKNRRGENSELHNERDYI